MHSIHNPSPNSTTCQSRIPADDDAQYPYHRHRRPSASQPVSPHSTSPAPQAASPLGESPTCCTSALQQLHDKIAPLPADDNQRTPPLQHNEALLPADDAAAPNFDCSICLDVCYDPVATMCGHLFCWPCLYRWLAPPSHLSRTQQDSCPVCKSNVRTDRVIPLYGRGMKDISPELLAERFPGIHNIPPRPCSPTEALYSGTPEKPLHPSTIFSARHVNEHRQVNVRLRQQHHIVLTFFLSLLPSSFCRLLLSLHSPRTGSSLLSHQRIIRRFNNEKEFAVHWGFIVFALVASLGFVVLS